MAGHRLLKRKGGVDEISDDFSDFSLSSPATKIRRLDGVLPPIVEEDEPVAPVPNEERALVLFKPLCHSPSSFSLTLDSDLLSGIKNQLPWSKQSDSDCDRLIEEERNNHRLAIVPWVPQPSPSSHHSPAFDDSDNNADAELMEAEEMGAGGEGGGVESMMMMDVEQEDTSCINSCSTSTIHHPAMLNLHQGVSEGFQQHCLLPQLPQKTSTRITWTR